MRKAAFCFFTFFISNYFLFPQCSPLVFDLFNTSHTDTTSILVLDLKADFCAIGDGTTSDHVSFNTAATFINSRKGYCDLIIPPGIYRIGKQDSVLVSTNFYQLKGEDVFSINNCRKVKVIGSATTNLLYSDFFRYGTFDSLGNIFNHSMPFYDLRYVSDIGQCFKIQNCDSVQLINLTIDGNFYSGNIILGGDFGDVGKQISHSGIFVWQNKNLIIDSIKVKRFGLDGIIIINDGTNSNLINNQILNSTFDYNGRQGLSWVGGDSLKVNYCIFSNTGKGIISSSPGAGIDIEPESHFSSLNYCKRGYFNNCKIMNNTGPGLVSDLQSNIAQNINFINSEFVGTTTYSSWVRQKDFNFIDCSFYGTVVHNYGSNNINEATFYQNCLFSDCLHDSIGGIVNVFQDGSGYLINCSNAQNVMYDSCVFNSYVGPVMWFRNTTVGSFYIKNSTINSSWNNVDYVHISGMHIQNSVINSYGNYCCSFDSNCNSSNQLVATTINNWSGIAPACNITTATFNNNEKTNLSIFPNPSSMFMVVETDNLNIDYSIKNILGQEVKKGILMNYRTEINIESLTSGIYFFIGKNFKTIKFIKQ